MLEDLEGDSVNPAISHNSKIDTAYNPVNNRNIESGIMPTRKGIMSNKFEAHQQNVEAHQAPLMSFHDIKIGDECSNIKAVLSSAEPTDMLCKLLKVQSAPDVDMECFDGNAWSIITSWHYSEKSLRVRLKIHFSWSFFSVNTSFYFYINIICAFVKITFLSTYINQPDEIKISLFLCLT